MHMGRLATRAEKWKIKSEKRKCVNFKFQHQMFFIFELIQKANIDQNERL